MAASIVFKATKGGVKTEKNVQVEVWQVTEKKKKNYVKKLQRQFEEDTGKDWSDPSFRYWLMFKIHSDLNDGNLYTKADDVPEKGKKYITEMKYSR